jgi:putative ABC transport system ATP-binding protein
MILISSMTKIYQMGDTEVRALDGVDISIAEGEFVSITGASGSGKSTLMHLLGCLDRPTSGTYEFDGYPVHRYNDKQLAAIRNRAIGFVFQTFNLINRTSAIDNVAVPLIYGRSKSTTSKAKQALERVGLAKRARHKPSELSGGERQRVAIARAIVNHPRLILADEPTGNLDSRTGDQIMEIFHSLHQDRVTVVLVTHEMQVAAQAQRLIRMRDGKIVEDRQISDELRGELMQTSVRYLGKPSRRDAPAAPVALNSRE